jgi:hypothetical protein
MTDAREMILTREPNGPLYAECFPKLSSPAERGTSRRDFVARNQYCVWSVSLREVLRPSARPQDDKAYRYETFNKVFA